MKWLIWILLAVMLALVGWRVFFRDGSPSYQPTPASTSAYTGRALHGDRKTRIAAIAEVEEEVG